MSGSIHIHRGRRLFAVALALAALTGAAVATNTVASATPTGGGQHVQAFAGDLPRRTTDLMQATQRPFSLAAFVEPSGDPAWETIPSWYLVATNDHAIPPKTQRFMAQRAGATTSQVAASHVPMMSQPESTLATILHAVHAVD